MRKEVCSVFNGDRARVGFVLNAWDKLWLAAITVFAVVTTVVNIILA